MANQPTREFGKRRPAAIPAAQPAKRSSHVALLLMGTFAVGGARLRADAERELRTAAGSGAGLERAMSAARIFVRRRRRFVVAQQLLQQR